MIRAKRSSTHGGVADFLSTRQFAEILSVSESSVKRWIDTGRIVATRTPGGHRRIAFPDALRFIREERVGGGLSTSARQLVAPASRTPDAKDLLGALFGGDVSGVEEIVLGSWLSGRPLAEVWDCLVRPALEEIGELWESGPEGILIEHRATDIVLGVMNQVRFMIPEITGNAHLAIGCAPEQDPYLLPSMAVSTVLAEAGWQTVNLGPLTPVAALQQAVEAENPELVWISVSRALRADEIDDLIAHVQQSGQRLVVAGGRGIPDSWNPQAPGIVHGRSMTDLVTLLGGLESGELEVTFGRERKVRRGRDGKSQKS